MDSSFNCLECGASVQGGLAHHDRGFCSLGCSESWDEWMARERSFAIPGLGDLFLDGGNPTLEQALLYITVVLGCLIGVAITEIPSTFTMTAAFEWSCSDHELFIGVPGEAFRGIDGFSLAGDQIYLDDDENVGHRRIELRERGDDLTKVCVELILEVLSTKRRFDRECDMWALRHAGEVRMAAKRYMVSAKVRKAGSPAPWAYAEFTRWLDSLSGDGRRWA